MLKKFFLAASLFLGAVGLRAASLNLGSGSPTSGSDFTLGTTLGGTSDFGGNSLFLYPSFLNPNSGSGGTEALYWLGSGDGKSFSHIGEQVMVPATGGLRDPCVKFLNNRYYNIYTTGTQSGSFAGGSVTIKKSEDLMSWQTVIELQGPTGANRMWSPDFFQDTDGTVYVAVAVSTNAATGSAGSGNFYIYVCSATASDLSTWGPWVQVTGEFLASRPQNTAPHIEKKGSVYVLFYKDEEADYVEFATSAAVSSGYARVGSGNWASWGAGYEDISLVQVSSATYRIYLDKYTEQGFWYSEVTDWNPQVTTGWSALVQTATPYPFPNGTILRSNSLKVMRDLFGLSLSYGRVWSRGGTGAPTAAVYLGNVGVGEHTPATSRVHIRKDTSGSMVDWMTLENRNNAAGTGGWFNYSLDTTANTNLARLGIVRRVLATGDTDWRFYTTAGGSLGIGMTLYGTGTAGVAKFGINTLVPNEVLSVSSATTSTASMSFLGVVQSLPTTGVSIYTLAVQASDKKLYLSTETVTSVGSWQAIGQQ